MDKIKIQIDENEKIWFTSDLHFEHKNILKFCNRPYETIKDMNIDLINRWNSVVGDDDIAFILGDVMWFDSRTECKKTLEKLRGKEIHIIPGNHDTIKSFEYLSDRFIIHDSCVTCYITTATGINELFLCHFPMATWPHWENNTIHLFGHIHSGPLSSNAVDNPGDDLILKDGKCYDVGADNNNYTPIEIRDIYSKLNKIFK